LASTEQPLSAAESHRVPSLERSLIDKALHLACPSWNPKAVAVEQFLAGGYRNKNYRVRYGDQSFVLRLAGQPSTPDFELELKRLRVLANLFQTGGALPQLAIAPVVASHAESGTLLTRWCNAPLLAECTGISAETLGSFLARLHERLATLTAGVDVVAPNRLTAQIQKDRTTAWGS